MARRRRRPVGKAAFKDMTGKTVGNWHVIRLVAQEDIFALDSDWTDYLWSCSCVKCGEETTLERRQIRAGTGKTQKRCETCKATEKQKLENQRMEKRLMRQLEQQKAATRAATVKALVEAGLSSYLIAKQLECTQANVMYYVKQLGLKLKGKSGRQPKYTSEEERKKAARERRGTKQAWTHTRNGRATKYATPEEARAAKLEQMREAGKRYRKERREAGLLKRPLMRNGRPAKYATEEEAREAQLQTMRDWRKAKKLTAI